jgi:creatinine amidohydrolase
MHADPGAVREDQRRALPQVKVGLIEGFAAGKQNFRQLGADQAYCGAPAEASAAEGAAQLEALAAIVLDALRETWPELFVRRPG